MPTPLPRSGASESARRKAGLLIAAPLLFGAAELFLVHHGWLPRRAALAGYVAVELGAVAYAAALMVHAIDDRVRARADTQGRRSAIDNLQSQAAALLEEISVTSRELDAANSHLRAATKVNALLALAAQHMPNAVIIADAKGTVLWTNVAWEKLSGMSQGDSARRPVDQLLQQVMNGFSAADGRRLIEGGQAAAIESRDTDREGRIRWFSVAFQPVRTEAQDVVNFIVLIDDFTAFREAHLRQRHSEEISIQVSHLAQIGAWEYILGDEQVHWEPELYRICQVELGYEPTLDKMADFFPDDEKEAFLRTVRIAIRDSRSFDLECPLVTALGQKRWVEVFGRPEFKDGKAVRLFGTVQDITARHEAEAAQRSLESQLFQLQKMETLGTLAGGIAHDFNNLLTGIIGNQDLAMEDLGPDHPARFRLEESRTATLLACELVEQILTFSRQTGGERVSTDMAAVIEEARRFLRSTVPASIQIEVKIEPRCGRVMADVTQLNQVLLNLGTNAAHAMQASGGTIVFALAPVEFGANQAAAHGSLRSGPYLRLSVRDTGHGMDVETRRRIFEPFFTTKAANEGTGLGLAIVHGIVRSHGGAIEVNSAPGKGTAVEVYLPMEESADHVDATPNPVAPPEGRGQLICIVDDEQIVAQTAKLTLERLKYTTMVFHTPLECLAALKNTSDRCGLLLTDQTMPEMDGIELSAQVRAFAPRLPIIIMSGYFSKISPDALEEIGGVSLLAKPFRVGELAKQVHAALESAKSELSSPPVG